MTLSILLARAIARAYDICDLYSRRWQVEIDLRQVKTTLEMEQFEVKSAEMFKKACPECEAYRRELIAGLLTYNIILSFMLQAAIKAGIEVIRLSFSKCFRRIRKVFIKGVPAFVKQGKELQGLFPWQRQRIQKQK